MMKLILASASPQRKKILKDAGYKFEIVHPKISEKIYGKKPSQIVKSLALKKARVVNRNGIIIGADTIVVLNGEIIVKPKNKNEAIKILRKLSGSEHFVYTGVAILDTADKKQIVDYEKTTVWFRKLSEENIKNVCGKYLDKAGAYSIQSKNDCFVKNIKGDYLNVVGFPLKKFQEMLKEL
ncbi:MAG: septum formation protein Maf [Elusimicrobia bacterium]|nr:septum formation protein Maf [Elusimicrobiota bacterium]